MGGDPVITTTIEQVLTPGQEARQLRQKTRAALRDIKRTGKASETAIHRTGRAARKDARRTALAQQLPPTLLGRTAYHATSTKDAVEAIAAICGGIVAIGTAVVAAKATWRELRGSKEGPEQATTSEDGGASEVPEGADA